MIILGATYKDRITGFKGVATGYAQYISGCHQALLAPKAGTDSQWIDEQRLERVGSSRVTLDNSKTPGCDKPAPIR
jgi:hypothetical protein